MKYVQIRIGRWGKLAWFPFEVLIAVLLVVNGFFGFFESEGLIPGDDYGPFRLIDVVNVTFVLGGASMLFGMWRLCITAEMIGLYLLWLGVFTTTIADLFFRPAEAAESLIVFLAVLWAVGVRLGHLAKGRVLVQVEEANDGPA